MSKSDSQPAALYGAEPAVPVPDRGAAQPEGSVAASAAAQPEGNVAAGEAAKPTETAPFPIRVLCGLPDPREAVNAPALLPFDPRVTAFLTDVSALLLKDPRAKGYPDVTTFAFFCRRANLENLRASYGPLTGRLGRGVIFHIAPSNVPMNFAYSLAAALLAGNASIVKASSRDFAQINLVCAVMQSLLCGAHAALRPYVNVVEYPREKQEITVSLSALCDVRVIWGGDETIRRVREAALPPRAFDLTFADRWSLLAIDAQTVVRMDDRALFTVAQGFYNDTYLYDQNACTTPRLIYWLGEGETLVSAQARFWQAVHAYAAPRYPIDPVTAVDKRIALYRAALTLGEATLAPMPDNLVVRIRLNRLLPAILDFRCGGGCFLEFASATLDPLASLLSKKAQTLSLLGVEANAVRDFVLSRGLRGVDRLTAIGHTMDFSLVWDGYDLIETLSRRVAGV